MKKAGNAAVVAVKVKQNQNKEDAVKLKLGFSDVVTKVRPDQTAQTKIKQPSGDRGKLRHAPTFSDDRGSADEDEDAGNKGSIGPGGKALGQKFGQKWMTSVNANFKGVAPKRSKRSKHKGMKKTVAKGDLLDDLFERCSIDSQASVDIEEYPAPDHDQLVNICYENMMKRAFTVAEDDMLHEEGDTVYKWRPFCGTGSKDMATLGSGVKLYFVLLKYFGLMFFIMLMCVVPNLYLFRQGSMFSELTGMKKNLGSISIANMGTCPEGGCTSLDITKNRCLLPTYDGSQECGLKVVDLAHYVGYFDAASLICYIVFGILLGLAIIPANEATDSDTSRVAKYTAMVYKMPEYIDGEEAQRNLVWGVGQDHRILLADLPKGVAGGAWKDLGIIPEGGGMPEQGSGPEQLVFIAMHGEWLFGVGQDGCVFKTVHRQNDCRWEKISQGKPKLECIGIYEQQLYGIAREDNIVWRATEKVDEVSESTPWEQVSEAGKKVKAITLHEGEIFAVGDDNSIMVTRMHVDKDTKRWKWYRWAPGDQAIRFCRCCRRRAKLKPLDIKSIAIAGGRMYAASNRGFLYSQSLSTLKSDGDAWRKEKSDTRINSIYIYKERRQQQYAQRLGNHIRRVLMDKESRDRGKRWYNKQNVNQMVKGGVQKIGRSSIRKLQDVPPVGEVPSVGRLQTGEAAWSMAPPSESRRSMSQVLYQAATDTKGLLLQKMWDKADMIPSKYEADIVLDARNFKQADRGETCCLVELELGFWFQLERLGFSFQLLEDSLLICEYEEADKDNSQAVDEDGILQGSLLHMWNLQQPFLKVIPGHRIVEINGLEQYPMKMVEELEQNVLLAIKVDKAIRDVVIVRDNGSTLDSFIQSGKLQQDILNMRVIIQNDCIVANDKAIRQNTKKLQKLLQKAEGLTKSLKDQAQLPDECKDVCLAFITFTSQEVREDLMKEYRYSAYRYWRPMQTAKLRFYGTPLMIVPAPDAGDLQWENLDFSRRTRRLRKWVMKFATFLIFLVCCTFIAIGMNASKVTPFSLKKKIWVVSNTVESKALCLKMCDVRFYGGKDCSENDVIDNETETVRYFSRLGDINRTKDQVLNGGCPNGLWQSPGCNSTVAKDGDTDWLAVEFTEPRSVGCMKLTQNATGVAESLRIYACDAESLPGNGTAGSLKGWHPNKTCTTMKKVEPSHVTQGRTVVYSGKLNLDVDKRCAINSPNGTISYDDAKVIYSRNADNWQDPTLSCYCLQQLASHAKFLIPPYTSPGQLVCQNWIVQTTSQLSFLGIGVVTVLVVNQLLMLAYGMMIKAEKHFTETDAAVSTFKKVFMSMFVNTGMLTFFVNSRIGSLDYTLIKTVGIGHGQYWEPNQAWLLAVGVSMSITIFLLPFSNTLPQLGFTIYEKVVYLPMVLIKSVTKDWAEQHYLLSCWNLPIRLAQTMNAMTVIMMYSPGMPILYLVGIVYCLCAFWIDKWMLLRGTSKPPVYSKEVVEAITQYWAVGAVVHACVSAWTYSNQQLLPSGWHNYVRDWVAWIVRVDAWEEGGHETYEDVIARWEMLTDDDRKLMYWEYIWVRVYDLGRWGASASSTILLFYLTYYFVYMTYTNLMEPVLSPFIIVVKFSISQRLKHSSCIKSIENCITSITNLKDPFGLREAGIKAAPPIHQTLADMKNLGYITSYQMKDNHRYRLAYEGIAKYEQEKKNTRWISGFARQHREAKLFMQVSLWSRVRARMRRILLSDLYGRPIHEAYKGPMEQVSLQKCFKLNSATKDLLKAQFSSDNSYMAAKINKGVQKARSSMRGAPSNQTTTRSSTKSAVPAPRDKE